jgi:rhomboid protease GluP
MVAVHVATAWAVARPGLPLWRALLLPRGLQHRVLVGGQYSPLVAGEPWRLCTTVLLHVDVLHLAFNVAALVSLGWLLEPRVGSVRWLAWLAIGGFAGALVSHLAGVRQSDGASGGAFALLAGALVLGWRWRAALSPDDRWLFGPVLGGFLALNLAVTFVMPQINAAAHLGGLGAGVLLALASELPGMRALEGLLLGAFVGACAFGWILG